MSVFESVIGWLAPPTCLSCGKEGSAICGTCSERRITPFGARCWRCNRLSQGSRTCDNCRRIGSPGKVWIVTNHEDAARSLLSLYKFSQQRAAVEPIARLMADTFLESTGPVPAAKDYLVVPVPTATARIRERGFDHTDLLAKRVAMISGLREIKALRRLDQTRQLGSKREDRLAQLTGSFAVKNPLSIHGRKILLIDDVITTGGTLIAAAKILRAAGAKSVDALVFAKRL